MMLLIINDRFWERTMFMETNRLTLATHDVCESRRFSRTMQGKNGTCKRECEFFNTGACG